MKVIVLLLLILTVDGFCSAKPDDTLVVVNGVVITAGRYAESYKEKITKIGLTDNVDTRKKYLDNLVNDEILIQHARRSKLHRTKPAQNEYKRIYLQELLNYWSDKHISPEINITDQEIKDLYIKLNTKIKVSHLYASTKNQADSILNLLNNGKRFNDLAREIFIDPLLRDNGGSLGYISVDEMDPDFEKAAYLMKPGEISKPVKTVQGYSIIRVDDIQRNPLTTEYEYLKAYDRLKAFARKRAYEEKTKEFVSGLGKELNVKFNDALTDKFFNLMLTRSPEKLIETPSLISGGDLNSVVVSWRAGSWNLLALINEMKLVPEKQLKWIRTEENLKDFITGLVNRNHISSKAINEKLDTSASFRSKLKYEFDTYLLTMIENRLKDKIKVSSDSVREYYQRNSSLFKTKPEIRLSSILLNDSSTAYVVRELLFKNTPFEELAKKYSVQTITAEKGGDIGYYKKEDLDYLGDEVFTMKTGEWKGPFRDNDKYVYLKCTDHRESVIKPYSDCSDEIKNMLGTFKWYSLRDQYIESLKKNMNVQVFPDKLISIQLN